MFHRNTSEINRQLTLAIQLNDEATWDDFCWDNNLLLQQQLSYALQKQGERLFYIWGNPGCGKSHLLQACCQTNNAYDQASYLPLSILKQWGPESIEGIERQALVAIDDIESIAQHKAWEEAVFHLYNKLRECKDTLVIISGKSPPQSSSLSLPDLQSRLSWGLVDQLHELSDELKIQTLQQHAKKRGIQLSTHVLHFLINRCARNMHELHRLLNQLDEASLIAQRKITVPFIKETLNL